MAKRANFLVAAARWAKGFVAPFGGRREPWTGLKQRYTYGQGWITTQAAPPEHPKPPKLGNTSYMRAPGFTVIHRPAKPIGVGRIGVGETIGTGSATPLKSWKGGRTTVGERGIIGFSRIGGDGPIRLRGSAGSAAGSSGKAS